ncbi:MAG: hypothetical protein Q4C97_01140 [Bacillota bacterium]|nr:hypothetical protein [Bacillota bacterium]
MDKTEYRMKLDEINRLVEAQDYEGALVIADSIDWRRVKSVRTLCMVADIYEVNGELEQSMKMLQLAYKRSSVGKMILYRQVELSLKMGQYDEAVEYYNHYLETASNDTSKYILKYKIYKAQNAPLDDQIAILEEYRDREYTERWVYELARLYKKAGRENKCVETCDDLILWFGEGKYVKKAMELKMNYAPLTAEQKSKYELWGEDKKKTAEPKRKKVTAATVAGISAAAMESLQKASVIPSDGENREDSQIVGMEKAAAAKEQEPENEEIPEVPVQEPQIHVDTAQLQERLAKSFQEVLSGFNRTRVVNAFEALGRATGSETVSEPEEENIEEYHVTELEPEAVNETVISADQGVSGAHTTVEPDVIERKPEKSEKTEDKEVTSIQEMNLEELFAETSGALAEAAGGKAEEIREKEPEEELKIPEVAVAPEEELEIPEIAEVPEVSEPTEPEDETAEAAMAAFEASLGEELEISFEEEQEEQDEVEELKASLSAGDTQELDLEAQLRAVMGDQEPIVEEAKEEPKEEQESSLAETLIPDLDLDLVLEVQKEKEDGIEEKVSALEMTESIEDIPEIQEVEEAEASEPMILEEPEKPVEATVKLPQVETPEEKRMRILNDTRPEKLTEHQKNLFSYFAKVPGMDEQILDAIHGAFEYAGEKTSHRGNIAIMGSHGTGKTRLSEGLVKALCKEMGLEAAKYANLDASDMNRKDPAAIIGKMAGGFLLIERASFMTAETIQKLSQAMDFRTDSMILIIEDDKANMRKLLADYPEFAEKFATVISIPVFTNDELVTFARTYAKENGYRMDEMGVLALYTLIGDNQREDEPITIGKVKEMVDGAIRKASGIRLGRKISKRHTDEDGRIFLYEKDFDI